MNLKIEHCKADTEAHILEVIKNLHVFVKELLDRASKHDASKLESPELEGYAEADHLRDVEYNSPEYLKMLDELEPVIAHHYANNRHHIEHWKNGLEDFTLVDLTEMLADWKAATKRNKNGNILKSIEHNAKRFSLPPIITKILENTVKEYFND